MNRQMSAVMTGMIGMRSASAKSACQTLASRITLLEMLQQMSASPNRTNPTKSVVSPQCAMSMISPKRKATHPMTSASAIHLPFSCME